MTIWSSDWHPFFRVIHFPTMPSTKIITGKKRNAAESVDEDVVATRGYIIYCVKGMDVNQTTIP